MLALDLIQCQYPDAARFFLIFFSVHYIKYSDLRKSRFSSYIFKMLKSSVGYENFHSNSPLHDKQTLKFYENRLDSFFTINY